LGVKRGAAVCRREQGFARGRDLAEVAQDLSDAPPPSMQAAG
jgi:hypothetical protein